METTLETCVPQPYDLMGCLRGHGWAWLEPCALTGTGLRRVELLGSGRAVALTLGAAKRDGAAHVQIRASLPLTTEEEAEVLRKVRWMLRLDEDLSEFYVLCAERGEGYRSAIGRGRLLRSSTLFEDAFKVILTTNTTWRQTMAMVARTVRALGEPVPDSPELRAFPTPKAVASAGERFFREEVRLGYRSGAVVALAERASELESLRESDLPTPELRRRLLSFRGVGPYAAATLLMLLGRYDYLAVDTDVRSFTARKYFGGERATEARIQAIYEDWGRWKYLGYWFDILSEWPGGALTIPDGQERA